MNADISLPTFVLSEALVRPECTREFSTGMVSQISNLAGYPALGYPIIEFDFGFNREKGAFSCLEGFLMLRRRISYYFTHLYIPSFFCILVSWTSFWLKKEFHIILEKRNKIGSQNSLKDSIVTRPCCMWTFDIFSYFIMDFIIQCWYA